MLKPKYKTSEGSVFTFSLPDGGGGTICSSAPIRYATGYNILYFHTVSCPYSTAIRYELVAWLWEGFQVIQFICVFV